MHPRKVLISHAHDEKALAEAWKKLLEEVSLGAVEVWFSSDVSPGGGMGVGKEWREQLYSKLEESDFIIAVQTPTSAGRPWIMWECGVASGVAKERGLIPIVYSMGRGDLSNPLTTYQVYQGEDKGQVQEVCSRLVQETALHWNQTLFDTAFGAYLETVGLHRPRPVIRVEQMNVWKSRFEELVRLGRASEVLDKRRAMYEGFGVPFTPVEPTLHELLSKILLDQKRNDEAIQEVDYALLILGDDIDLLHRKALALAQKQNLSEAEAIINKLLNDHPGLKNNPELASLEGRINRERWQLTGGKEYLDKAFDSYFRAYEADKMQYYPGINAASLALARGHAATAEKIFADVLRTCETLQQRPVVSYWTDFTAGDALLGMGQTEEAVRHYRKAFTREPPPPPFAKESALKGVRRMAEARGLPQATIEEFEKLLG